MVGGLIGTTDDVRQRVMEPVGRVGEGIGEDEEHFGSGSDHMWSEYSWR